MARSLRRPRTNDGLLSARTDGDDGIGSAVPQDSGCHCRRAAGLRDRHVDVCLDDRLDPRRLTAKDEPAQVHHRTIGRTFLQRIVKPIPLYVLDLRRMDSPNSAASRRPPPTAASTALWSLAIPSICSRTRLFRPTASRLIVRSTSCCFSDVSLRLGRAFARGRRAAETFLRR